MDFCPHPIDKRQLREIKYDLGTKVTKEAASLYYALRNLSKFDEEARKLLSEFEEWHAKWNKCYEKIVCEYVKEFLE